MADEEDPLAERRNGILGLLELMLGRASGPYERAVLDRAIYQTYAREWSDADGQRGGIRRGEITSYRRAAPVMRDLHAVLTGYSRRHAAGLAARLERYVEGSLGGGLFADQRTWLSIVRWSCFTHAILPRNSDRWRFI